MVWRLLAGLVVAGVVGSLALPASLRGAALAAVALAAVVLVFVLVRQLVSLCEREALVRERLSEFTHHYSTAPVAISLVDRDLRFLRINEGMAALNGIPAADHLGRTLMEMLPPQISDQLVPIFDRVIETGEPVLNLELHGPNPAKPGEDGDWLVSYHPFLSEDGEVKGVSSVVQDVTEHKQAVEALRRSERLNRLVNDNIPAMIAHVNEELRYSHINRQYASLVGSEPDQILGRTVREVVGDELFQVIEPRIREVFKGKPVPFEVALTRKLGREGHFTVTYVPDVGEAGQVQGFYVFMLDITEQKQAQRRQQLMVHELDHRVKNTLAAVLALVDQTLCTSPSLEDFRESFVGRLRSMARSHEALARGKWDGVDLGEVVRLSLEPFLRHESERLNTRGDATCLPSSVALPLGLALHEMTTNCAKYGALSTPAGRLDLEWEITGESSIVLTWQEHGGPPVSAPRRTGFGLRLIRGLIEKEIGGQVEFRFDPGGLVGTLKVPIAN